MQYTALNTIPSLTGKSREIRVLFAEIANEAISKGRTEDEAVFKGLAAVKQKEQTQVKKFTKPVIPAHLRAILDLKGIPQATRIAQEELEEVEVTLGSQEPQQSITSALFNAKGQLVLKFSDGKTITTNPAPIMAVEHSVVVANGNSSAALTPEVIEGLTELDYTGQELVRVDMPDGSYKELTYALGVLVQVDHIQATQIVRKTLNYIDGILTSVLTDIL